MKVLTLNPGSASLKFDLQSKSGGARRSLVP
jgi:acetate kinase